jgi:hypothetical protein
MAKSRHRQKPIDRRPRKRGAKAPLETINNVIRIKPNVFEKMRENEDFAAMIRVGRLMNVLAFSMEVVAANPPIDEKDPLTLRRFVRTMFLTAGYIYEGYELITSLYPKYYKEEFFAKFAEIYNDPEKTSKRNILRLMRNAGAFHLDSDNKSTKKALTNLKVKKFDLISGSDGTYSTLYFHLSDTLDINYVIDELKTQDDEDETEIYRKMGLLPGNLLGVFIRASDQFIEGLARKLKLIV